MEWRKVEPRYFVQQGPGVSAPCSVSTHQSQAAQGFHHFEKHLHVSHGICLKIPSWNPRPPEMTPEPLTSNTNCERRDAVCMVIGLILLDPVFCDAHLCSPQTNNPGPRRIRPIRQYWTAGSPVPEDFSSPNQITVLFLSPNGHINLKLIT